MLTAPLYNGCGGGQYLANKGRAVLLQKINIFICLSKKLRLRQLRIITPARLGAVKWLPKTLSLEITGKVFYLTYEIPEA